MRSPLLLQTVRSYGAKERISEEKLDCTVHEPNAEGKITDDLLLGAKC